MDRSRPAPPQTHTAFCYGTLMAPPVLHRVIHGSSRPTPEQAARISFLPALLYNYRRHRVSGCDYPAIKPHEDSTVRGNFVSGLSEMDLMRLDIFEGDQYERKKVQVKVFRDIGLDEKVEVSVGGKESSESAIEYHGEGAEAETYVFRQEYWNDLEPAEWDFEEFKREKMRFWMGEPRGWDDIEYGEEHDANHANGVQIDEGFADVDRAVAEGRVIKDPTGGRGMNGSISKQLKELGSP